MCDNFLTQLSGSFRAFTYAYYGGKIWLTG